MIPALPAGVGICTNCDVRNDLCDMTEMLTEYKRLQGVYGPDLDRVEPGLWAEVAIDDPEYDENGVINWCPLYSVDVEAIR